MRFAPPKEKPDAAASRQAAVRDELEKAEKAYYKEVADSYEAVNSWFYHTSEKNLFS